MLANLSLHPDCAQAKYNSKPSPPYLSNLSNHLIHPFPVRCNSVHPGYIDTPLLRSLHTTMEPAAAKAFLDDVVRRHPIGRLGVDREIADAILFLSCEESSFMSGLCGLGLR
jgi:NAD(P)-dependent dehydrogenase (short-subunit alcohol dehydrogenase family)